VTTLDVSVYSVTPSNIAFLKLTVTNHFDIGALMEKGVRLIGCGQSPVQKCNWRSSISPLRNTNHVTDWQELFEMVEKGEVDPTLMVTHRIKLEDIDKAYHLQERRQDGLVKCFVEPRFSEPRLEGTAELSTL